MVEAAACPNKFCTYPCSLDADMCENCNTKFPENFKETFYEISDLTAYHLQNMKNIACILFINNIKFFNITYNIKCIFSYNKK